MISSLKECICDDCINEPICKYADGFRSDKASMCAYFRPYLSCAPYMSETNPYLMNNNCKCDKEQCKKEGRL